MAGTVNSDRMTRLAPDPVAAILCAVAALAAVASIAAINWVAEDERTDAAANRRRPKNTLRDLERNCLGLRDVLKRLERNLQLFSGDRGSIATAIKFGVHAIQVPQGSFALHQAVVTEIAALFDETSRNSFEVMCLIEDGVLDPPEETFFQFAEVQERLNNILINRIALKPTIEEAIHIADQLAALVQSLKAYGTQ